MTNRSKFQYRIRPETRQNLLHSYGLTASRLASIDATRQKPGNRIRPTAGPGEAEGFLPRASETAATDEWELPGAQSRNVRGAEPGNPRPAQL